MRRILRIGILCAALAAILCVSAFAAEVTDTSKQHSGTGYSDVTAPSGVTVTGLDENLEEIAKATDVCWGTDDAANQGKLWANSVALNVKVSSNTPAYYVAILTTADNLTAISASNILFIDQLSGTDAKTEGFKVYPKEFETSSGSKTAMHLYITQTGGESATDVELNYANAAKYVDPGYTPGDVNGDGKIDSKDSLRALLIWGSPGKYQDAEKLAANVNGDNKVDSKDSLRILLHWGKPSAYPFYAPGSQVSN